MAAKKSKPAKKAAPAKKKVQPIPAGYHSVTPYLVVRGVAGLIDFLKATFDAREMERFANGQGGVAHAQVKVGDSLVMMGEPMGEQPAFPAMLYVYVKDCDAAHARAVAAGATSIMGPRDAFYGDRNAGVKDAWGNQWWMATHQEDVSPAELARRAARQHGG